MKPCNYLCQIITILAALVIFILLAQLTTDAKESEVAPETSDVGVRSGDGVVTYHAVVCGIENYQGSLYDLNYCHEDADGFRYYASGDSFQNGLLSWPNWDSSNITLLKGSVTKSQIRTAIQNMGDAADEDDVCVFFFAGHGDWDYDVYPYDESDYLDEYLVTYDGIVWDPYWDEYYFYYDDMVRDDELGDWMAALPTNKYVVFLDACWSGGHIKGLGKVRCIGRLGDLTPQKGDGFAADLIARMKTRDLDDNYCGVVVTACDDDEGCAERSDLQHGVFTYCLLKGMGGPADDNYNDWISAEECYYYARPCALNYYSDQHAQMYDGHSGELEFLCVTCTAPTITSHPSPTSLTICSGQSQLYCVTASGTPSLSYQWQKDASNIPGATSSCYTATQSGSYRCVVTNLCGSATSNNAALTVNLPPSITQNPQDVTEFVGEDAIFTVTATGSEPLHYQWKKDGQNVGGDNSTLTLDDVQMADNGAQITCEVSNTCGTAPPSNPATLTVLAVKYTINASAGPNGTVEPNGVFDVNFGDDVTFTAEPNDGYTVDWWYLDGNSVQRGNTSYTLYNVQADHNVFVTFIEILPMDLNNDGILNFSDFAIFAFYWMDDTCSDPDWCEGSDFDKDGIVGIYDLPIFTKFWLWPLADVDMDGKVNFADFAVFANHWMEQNCTADDWCEYTDLNKSGQVDAADLRIFAEYWLEGEI